MLVLALDTTGPHCAACLARDGEVLAHASERLGRGHAERLAPMVIDVMAQAGVTPGKIDRLAVCTGPGSFTGLRVGLSYAKGFALPRRLPVIGVNALEICANDALQRGEAKIVAMRDVRRGEFIAAAYDAGRQTHPLTTLTEAEATELAASLGVPFHRVEEANMRVLAGMAASLDPAAYPATALYSRAPDAKLPGGKSLGA